MAIRSTEFRVKSTEKFFEFCQWVGLTAIILHTDPDGSGLVIFFSTDLDAAPDSYRSLEGDQDVEIDFDTELKRLMEPGQEVKYEVVYLTCIRPNGEVEIEEPEYPEFDRFIKGDENGTADPRANQRSRQDPGGGGYSHPQGSRHGHPAGRPPQQSARSY